MPDAPTRRRCRRRRWRTCCRPSGARCATGCAQERGAQRDVALADADGRSARCFWFGVYAGAGTASSATSERAGDRARCSPASCWAWCCSFFAILLLSNIITALSSFFLARDLDLLVSSPVDWLRLYVAKLGETLVHSSWMVVLMAVPILAAYGVVYDGGAVFVVLALGGDAAVPGHPGGGRRRAHPGAGQRLPRSPHARPVELVAVLAVGALVLLFRLMRPEQLARPEGLRTLLDFIALLRTPTSPFLPSEWVQRAIMSSLTDRLDLLPLYLLWSTAAAAWCSARCCTRALCRRVHQGAGGRAAVGPRRHARARRPVGAVSVQACSAASSCARKCGCSSATPPSGASSSCWRCWWSCTCSTSSLCRSRGRGHRVSARERGVVPQSRAGGVRAGVDRGAVHLPGGDRSRAADVAARSSPLPMRELLWSKYWMGTLPLLVLALLIVGVTNVLLQVTPFIYAVSVFTIAFLTFAVAALALGLGAIFPRSRRRTRRRFRRRSADWCSCCRRRC